MGFGFTVEIDTSDLERDWQEALGVLSDGIRRGVQMAITEGAAEAKATHSYKDQTGLLTKSIGSRMLTSARGGAVGYMRATAPYASYIDGGTKPHEIRPKEGQGFMGPTRRGQTRRTEKDIGTYRVALRWTSGGKVHFAKVVHHPGTRPYAFMGTAYLKAERVLLREVEIAAVKAAEIMSR